MAKNLQTRRVPIVPGHPKLAQLLSNYATLLRDEGKYAESESLYKRALEVWGNGLYPDHPDVAEKLTNYATLLRKLDRQSEAEPLEARASTIRTKAEVSNQIN